MSLLGQLEGHKEGFSPLFFCSAVPQTGKAYSQPLRHTPALKLWLALPKRLRATIKAIAGLPLSEAGSGSLRAKWFPTISYSSFIFFWGGW